MHCVWPFSLLLHIFVSFEYLTTKNELDNKIQWGGLLFPAATTVSDADAVARAMQFNCCRLSLQVRCKSIVTAADFICMRGFFLSEPSSEVSFLWQTWAGARSRLRRHCWQCWQSHKFAPFMPINQRQHSLRTKLLCSHFARLTDFAFHVRGSLTALIFLRRLQPKPSPLLKLSQTLNKKQWCATVAFEQRNKSKKFI